MLGKQGTANTLDPTIVVETVVEQAIDLAFTLGMTKSVVMTNIEQ